MTVWPLEHVNISDNYGWRTHPIHGDRRHHNGLDFAAGGGTPLLAIQDMRLVSKGYNPNGAGHWATWELVAEPFVSFGYWHQDRPVAHSVGDVVREGGTVGYVGTTGTSTGNHLHLEMYHGGALRDPWAWLVAATEAKTPSPITEIQPVQEDEMRIAEVPELGRQYLVTPNGCRWVGSSEAVTGINILFGPTKVIPFAIFYPMWSEINALNTSDTALAGNDDIDALAKSLNLPIPA